MTQIELWLTQYETDVRFPDVSGMEHLDMLITRSNIGTDKETLTSEQLNRLHAADEVLYHNAERFTQAIMAVADLAEWRNARVISPEEWWWYLDVLTSVPQFSIMGSQNPIR